jgi:hypothetical protein
MSGHEGALTQITIVSKDGTRRSYRIHSQEFARLARDMHNGTIHQNRYTVIDDAGNELQITVAPEDTVLIG